MKAKKRIGKPAEWPDGRLTLTYAIATRDGGKLRYLKSVTAKSVDEAWRKAFWSFPELTVEVYHIDEWRSVEADDAKGKTRTKGKHVEHPAPEPEPAPRQPPAEQRLTYEKLKADYYADKPVQISEELRQQFEAFRPRKEIGPLLHEVQTNHRTKPIGTHKWRPTSVNFDRCADIMEHENDHEQETA